MNPTVAMSESLKPTTHTHNTDAKCWRIISSTASHFGLAPDTCM
ncbi:hypothetical protein EYZ11_011125 [Aspergillus tanneri]|uniref:Uncharacterized protein n=1 Tax=Aspergillus tanneri TaxID=1220188 RepID=A0A4V3UN15_9EURO|nr:hypothetical protein EYZ11_011125 [Aspergillus tanneri]